jgi:hypothetical protein
MVLSQRRCQAAAWRSRATRVECRQGPEEERDEEGGCSLVQTGVGRLAANERRQLTRLGAAQPNNADSTVMAARAPMAPANTCDGGGWAKHRGRGRQQRGKEAARAAAACKRAPGHAPACGSVSWPRLLQ